MNINPPSPERFAALVAAHAHRYPEKAAVTVIGDRGLPVRLPFVFGNPAGASRMPAGETPSPAWNRAIATTLGLPGDEDPQRLLTDCMLWPEPPTWVEWSERWPAMWSEALRALRIKYGGADDAIEEPGFDEPPPAALASAVVSSPRVVWRRLKPPKRAPIAIAIESPPADRWQLFRDALQADGADVWRLTHEMVQAQVRACEMDYVELSLRWPGFVLHALRVISRLAGKAAKIEVGEW